MQKLDPLQYIWIRLCKSWFPNHPVLNYYQINWSRRKQKCTMASCCIVTKKVIVARELNYPEHAIWLEPLLYHELCHAYVGLTAPNPEKVFARHDKAFRALEQRHPLIDAFSQWSKRGGWEKAVRSDRAKRAWHTRRIQSINERQYTMFC